MSANQIKVNLAAISAAISELQSIITGCAEPNSASVELDGGGKTVSELQEILTIYAEISTGLMTLVSNTIAMMEKMRQEMANADAKAARLMQ